MPDFSDHNQGFSAYDQDKKTSKSKLADLVLATPDIANINNPERVARLKTHWTAKTLFDSTIKFKGWRKNYSKSGEIKSFKIIPYRGTGSVLFTQLVKGISQAPDNHKVVIMFSGIKYAKEKFKGCIEINYKGHTYYCEKPSLNKHTIRVRCSCKDFYFCFSLWDYIERAIVGPKPKKYIRKTPPPSRGGRPYVNPDHIPGFCKHAFNFLKYLKSKGFVKI